MIFVRRAGEARSSADIHFRTGTLRRGVQALRSSVCCWKSYAWSQFQACRITVACRDGNIYTVKNGQAHDDTETLLLFATYLLHTLWKPSRLPCNSVRGAEQCN